MGLAVVVGIVAGQVQGVHTQEWVHAWGLFARNSLIDVVFPQLFKSPDVHSHGVALAVVVFGTQSAHSLMDIFLREQIGKKLKQIEQTEINCTKFFSR